MASGAEPLRRRRIARRRGEKVRSAEPIPHGLGRARRGADPDRDAVAAGRVGHDGFERRGLPDRLVVFGKTLETKRERLGGHFARLVQRGAGGRAAFRFAPYVTTLGALRPVRFSIPASARESAMRSASAAWAS